MYSKIEYFRISKVAYLYNNIYDMYSGTFRPTVESCHSVHDCRRLQFDFRHHLWSQLTRQLSFSLGKVSRCVVWRLAVRLRRK